MRRHILSQTFPRRLGGGFTFEVQEVGREYFSGGFEAKAFSWGVIKAVSKGMEMVLREGVKVCFQGKITPDAPIHVFNTAFLPGAVGVTKKSGDAQRVIERVMLGKFGSIILGHGAPQGCGQLAEPGLHVLRNAACGFIVLLGDHNKA